MCGARHYCYVCSNEIPHKVTENQRDALEVNEKKVLSFLFEAPTVIGETSLAMMENIALPKAYPGSGLIRWYTASFLSLHVHAILDREFPD
jgi:hypothetical protein